MSAIPADLWIFLAAMVLVVPFGLWAYRRGGRSSADFAQTLADAMHARLEDDACVIDIDGLEYHVRQVVERRRHGIHRDILQVELDTVCPAWFSVIEQDAMMERLGDAIGGKGQGSGNVDSVWRLPGYRLDSASPIWAKSWLSMSRVRDSLHELMRQPVVVLRLKPAGVECRCLFDKADSTPPAAVVRALLDALHAVVTQAQGHKRELVSREEVVAPFDDRYSLLKVPFAVLAFAALAFLPAIGVVHGKPPLSWGAELELGAGVLCAIVGLMLFVPWLKVRAASREHATDIYVSAILLMGVALLLAGAAISRPLVYLLAG